LDPKRQVFPQFVSRFGTFGNHVIFFGALFDWTPRGRWRAPVFCREEDGLYDFPLFLKLLANDGFYLRLFDQFLMIPGPDLGQQIRFFVNHEND